MISVEEARGIIAAQIPPLPSVRVPLESARGALLRESARADAFYPEVDRSMMDGYGIAADDSAERFRVIGESKTGEAPTFAIKPGECARVFTGAPIPRGVSQVLKQEDVQREGEWMMAAQQQGPSFIRQRGEEAKPGDELLGEGMVLNAPELAILAQIGRTRPLVAPKPRVLHLATGDELVDPAESPAAGKIRDTNSTLIRALVEEAGGEFVAQSRCGDDLATIVHHARNEPSDLLLISGGASVGEYDFGARALRELGFTIHFDRVNLRPGKPLTFATRGAQAAFVLPGNPISHFVCFHVAIRLALERLRGAVPRWAFNELPVRGGSILKRDPRETFWPARVDASGGQFVVTPKRSSSSGDTFSLAGTNALIRLASDTEPGERLPVLLIALP